MIKEKNQFQLHVTVYSLKRNKSVVCTLNNYTTYIFIYGICGINKLGNLRISIFITFHKTLKIRHFVKTTGCLKTLFFFVIFLCSGARTEELLTFFNSPGNLLHYCHKNFENCFRNSWDNWGQSWNTKIIFWTLCNSKMSISKWRVPTVTSIISAISKLISKLLLCLSFSKFPGLLKKVRVPLLVCAPEKTKWILCFGTPCMFTNKKIYLLF